MHDVVEDTSTTQEDLNNQFGPEITDIVSNLTKLKRIHIKKSWLYSINPIEQNQVKKKQYEAHLENLRKMLIAMTKDIRIIFIKLNDRLHNMETLKALPKEKQQRIARETLEIYAPIAHRLGMGKLKGKLEDLAFSYVYPEEYKITKKLAGKEYEGKEKFLEEAKNDIKKELEKNDIHPKNINGRKKHLYSLWRKLNRYDNNINKIYDIVALRIIVNNMEDCYKTLGIIHRMYRPLIGRIKDYIAMPKPNGYQSIHTTVFGPAGNIIEIQIRTQEMHEAAEYGVAAHWHYKEKNRKPLSTDKNKLSWIKDLQKFQEEHQHLDKKEWSEILKLDFFRDRIFAFTPQGDVHDLPLGATPVDFAYAIHSEVGNATAGAKVNGKIVKLDYQLKNGDIVEIITSKKSSGPKRDWLKFVKTSKAKDKIRPERSEKTKLPFIK